ncbi:hypothetical protein GCM10027413_24980 [Conyzicola nivalis]|uniref:Uncharacterized protein n=1 Tax=Conyzicola nivalis TaxID=1477021 RepID=A0A916SA13_9MICO|nr:hypothetical protein GCM10010979_01640 [Conyzicola nivalis]
METTGHREGDSRQLSFAFWDRKIGPFLDAVGVLNVAALSGEELRVCEEFGDILALPTVGHLDVLYPAFQFGARGELLPGLREVSGALESGAVDSWDIALWLTTVRKSYGGKCAVDLIRAGRTDEVVATALRDGRKPAGPYDA